MTSLLVESLMVEGELEGSIDLLFSSKQNVGSLLMIYYNYILIDLANVKIHIIAINKIL